MDLISFRAKYVSISCISRSLLDRTEEVSICTRVYLDPRWWMGIARILRPSWRVSLPYFSLSLSFSPLYPFRISYTCVSVSLPQVSSPFLTLILYVLSLAPVVVRSSLPSLLLAHRAYRTIAGVWLTVYLKISIRLTRRGVRKCSEPSGLCLFVFRRFFSAEFDRDRTWNEKQKKLGTLPPFFSQRRSDERWKRTGMWTAV